MLVVGGCRGTAGSGGSSSTARRPVAPCVRPQRMSSPLVLLKQALHRALHGVWVIAATLLPRPCSPTPTPTPTPASTAPFHNALQFQDVKEYVAYQLGWLTAKAAKPILVTERRGQPPEVLSRLGGGMDRLVVECDCEDGGAGSVGRKDVKYIGSGGRALLGKHWDEQYDPNEDVVVQAGGGWGG